MNFFLCMWIHLLFRYGGMDILDLFCWKRFSTRKTSRITKNYDEAVKATACLRSIVETDKSLKFGEKMALSLAVTELEVIIKDEDVEAYTSRLAQDSNG